MDASNGNSTGQWETIRCFDAPFDKTNGEQRFFPLCEKDISNSIKKYENVYLFNSLSKTINNKILFNYLAENAWKKRDKYFCRTCTNPYDTMLEAIFHMKDVNDKVIYDMFCDGVGYFCICPRAQIIKQTHPRGIDCLYEKIDSKRQRNSFKDEL